MEKYNLKIYLKQNYKLLLIAEYDSLDKQELISQGLDRFKNNSQYLVLLTTYKINDVEILKS